MNTYEYTKEIKGITDDWHTIVLPNPIFKNVTSDLSDIRIYGITKEKDTIEAPYILQQNQEKRIHKNVVFKYANKSTTSKGSFITFKVTVKATINQIQLSFEEDNFDRFIAVEGSQNLKDWYTIVDDYRILSIKNPSVDYAFTKVVFPDSKYTYFRVFVKGKNAPEVKKAQITLQESEEANYNTYDIKSIHTEEENQNTIIDINLHTATPVSYIKIADNITYDYYRSVRIKYLRDSTQTKKGWKYNYQNLTFGTLNSIEENEFKFRSTITNKIRVIIDNQDNEPLDMGAIQIKGYTHELITRFTTPATYYLTYGNKNARKPSYDLQYLSDKVPEELKVLTLGVEKAVKKKEKEIVEPLFENKIWLWVVMGIVILLLGGSTLMMMKKK